MRLVSWNINHRGHKTAEQQGNLLHELAPHLMLLQEVNPGSSQILRDAAGADWMFRAIDLRTPEPRRLARSAAWCRYRRPEVARSLSYVAARWG